MKSSNFVPTREQTESVCLAFLAYTGEKLIAKKNPDVVGMEILRLLQSTLQEIPPLCRNGESDWEIVWGPMVYSFELAQLQDNMMFVARQRSNPTRYVVSVRGTNATAMLDWVEEDFEVWEKLDWNIPTGLNYSGRPKISKATHHGIDALLNRMTPVDPKLPGYPDDIAAFLTKITASGPVEIGFTGHSLGGALAPTLALWFQQSQGFADGWDPEKNASVSTISFAGATAGNHDFAKFFNQQLGNDCQRIHCNQDLVPHAWVTSELKMLPTLYMSAGIKMPEDLQWLLDFVERTVRRYEQIETSYAFDWELNPQADTYLKQVGYQHSYSYPGYFGVPDLNRLIKTGG